MRTYTHSCPRLPPALTRKSEDALTRTVTLSAHPVPGRPAQAFFTEPGVYNLNRFRFILHGEAAANGAAAASSTFIFPYQCVCRRATPLPPRGRGSGGSRAICHGSPAQRSPAHSIPMQLAACCP